MRTLGAASFASAGERMLEASWVVGTDGLHSAVREGTFAMVDRRMFVLTGSGIRVLSIRCPRD
jgi:2-polyprenyl-6-methoxyphenol hydroxylase-like FAD-dependent oxidoreductase